MGMAIGKGILFILGVFLDGRRAFTPVYVWMDHGYGIMDDCDD